MIYLLFAFIHTLFLLVSFSIGFNYKKILEIFKNIIVISKFTKKPLKKRSVFLLGLIGNLLVLSDILIILILPHFLIKILILTFLFLILLTIKKRSHF